jgi:hypothetical protein
VKDCDPGYDNHLKIGIRSEKNWEIDLSKKLRIVSLIQIDRRFSGSKRESQLQYRLAFLPGYGM